jgi:large subunit ribosomal protein L25
MEEGTSMRLSEIVLPEGVSLTALSHGSSDYDQSIVNIGKAKRSK